MNNNSIRQAYKGNVSLSFIVNGKAEKIQNEKIIYIMIEKDYINQTLPIVYISMSVGNELYTKISKYKSSAKFNLSISKQNVLSKSSISKTIINESFSYIVSSDNPNYEENLNETDERLDTSYKKIMIGLISINLSNKLRKSFNGVYNNIDQNTLIGLALEGTDVVLEKPNYNIKYDSIMIPPLTSRYQMLKFIFEKDAFYDTYFRYFIDFDKSYLLSKIGSFVDAKDAKLENIIVDIREITANESYYEGIQIKNNSYYVYINPINSKVSLNQGTEKVANQIIAINDDSQIQTLNLDINNTFDSDIKQTFVRSRNAALLKNELEMNSVSIEIMKQNIDGSEFSPNKCITVNNFGDYSKYNGKYIMTHKKEFFKSSAGEFTMSTIIGLSKVGNIEPYKSTNNSSSRTNTSVSNSSRRTTTASKRTYNSSTLARNYNNK